MFSASQAKRAAAAALFLFCTCAFAQEGKKQLVVAAHPLAAEAGLSILRAGGSAIDAAVAVQAMLGLVEPESSGIGGGAFLLHWSASEKRLRSYDGRETAPAAARPERFLRNGKPEEFLEAAIGGRSVGVPGVLRMLELAHRRHGRLPWAELFAPAIFSAEEGFRASARLRGQLEVARKRDAHIAAGNPYYVAGEKVVNRDYGATLRAIAQGGADAIHAGAIAKDIVAAVQAGGGDLSERDLADYRPVEREPLCGPYRLWIVCSMGPPSSGGLAVLQILGILERVPFAAAAPGSAAALHFFSEAGRLAYADRARYVGDPAFVSVPAARLLEGRYLDARARLIGERSLRTAPPGDPEAVGTSHFTIVDARGDIVSMTTTIEASFGSHVFVRGFFLNNELTDFDFLPGGANQVAPGKRPRSSMAPTIVFRDGVPVAALGSPGGPFIINYVAKMLVGVLDWRLGIAGAAALPNFGSRGGATEIELGSAYEPLAAVLALQRGHDVAIRSMTSGVHGIERVQGGWRGGADPRREGIAAGD
jgi:gamma-glutamyltranspeptidase/glutathione hydrolase